MKRQTKKPLAIVSTKSHVHLQIGCSFFTLWLFDAGLASSDYFTKIPTLSPVITIYYLNGIYGQLEEKWNFLGVVVTAEGEHNERREKKIHKRYLDFVRVHILWTSDDVNVQIKRVNGWNRNVTIIYAQIGCSFWPGDILYVVEQRNNEQYWEKWESRRNEAIVSLDECDSFCGTYVTVTFTFCYTY